MLVYFKLMKLRPLLHFCGFVLCFARRHAFVHFTLHLNVNLSWQIIDFIHKNPSEFSWIFSPKISSFRKLIEHLVKFHNQGQNNWKKFLPEPNSAPFDLTALSLRRFLKFTQPISVNWHPAWVLLIMVNSTERKTESPEVVCGV